MLRLAGMVIFAALLLAGCSTVQQLTHGGLTATPAPSADDMRRDADKKLAAFDYPGAEAGYRAVLVKNPADDAARLGMAESQLGQRKLDDARATFASLTDTPAYEALAHQGVGLVELRAGNLDAATTALKAAVDKNDALWRAWNALGQAYDLSKNWEASADAYAHALKNTPDASFVHNNIGVSLLAQGRYDDALKEFDGVLKINPKLTTARTNRQITLALMQRYPDAVAGMAPEDKARALNNIGYIAMLKGDYDSAEKYFDQAMQENPNNKTVQENIDLMQHLKAESDSSGAPGSAKN